MFRGTTPTLEFEIPFDTSLIDELFVTITQANVVTVEKDRSQCELSGNVITVKLTQKDTLIFKNKYFGGAARLQVRIKMLNGEALASDIIDLEIGEILKEGEI